MNKIDCKRILVSCQPRYWNDSEVNGIEDIDFNESKGNGKPQIPCAEQIKDKPTNVIHSDHWVWRPIIDVIQLNNKHGKLTEISKSKNNKG